MSQTSDRAGTGCGAWRERDAHDGPAHNDALIARARSCALEVLRDTPDRRRHSAGVAERAAELSVIVAAQDRDLVVAAAWLHDIGYAPDLRATGFHPLDGALYLTGHGWDERLASLVAHHSGARFVAQVRGLDDALARFPFESSDVADVLTHADQTVGPDGQRMPIRERIDDVLARHGPESPNARARAVREPYLLAVAGRVEARLASGETRLPSAENPKSSTEGSDGRVRGRTDAHRFRSRRPTSTTT